MTIQDTMTYYEDVNNRMKSQDTKTRNQAEWEMGVDTMIGSGIEQIRNNAQMILDEQELNGWNSQKLLDMIETQIKQWQQTKGVILESRRKLQTMSE